MTTTSDAVRDVMRKMQTDMDNGDDAEGWYANVEGYLAALAQPAAEPAQSVRELDRYRAGYEKALKDFKEVSRTLCLVNGWDTSSDAYQLDRAMDALEAEDDPGCSLHGKLLTVGCPGCFTQVFAWNGVTWMEGIAGGCNVVTYDGEDVRGVAYIADAETRANVIRFVNTRPQEPTKAVRDWTMENAVAMIKAWYGKGYQLIDKKYEEPDATKMLAALRKVFPGGPAGCESRHPAPTPDSAPSVREGDGHIWDDRTWIAGILGGASFGYNIVTYNGEDVSAVGYIRDLKERDEVIRLWNRHTQSPAASHREDDAAQVVAWEF